MHLTCIDSIHGPITITEILIGVLSDFLFVGTMTVEVFIEKNLVFLLDSEGTCNNKSLSRRMHINTAHDTITSSPDNKFVGCIDKFRNTNVENQAEKWTEQFDVRAMTCKDFVWGGERNILERIHSYFFQHSNYYLSTNMARPKAILFQPSPSSPFMDYYALFLSLSLTIPRCALLLRSNSFHILHKLLDFFLQANFCLLL